MAGLHSYVHILIERLCRERCWIFLPSVISLASLLAAKNILSSFHPELLNRVVIPRVIVNLGLQLSTVQSYLLVFSLLAVFSLSFSFASQAENMMLQS